MTVDINQIRQKLDRAIIEIGEEKGLKTLQEMAALAPTWLSRNLSAEHTIPSPSGILKCRRQLWLQAKGKTSTEQLPIYWRIRQALGVMQELYWMAVFKTAEFKITTLQEPVPCGAHMKG